LTSFQIQLRND